MAALWGLVGGVVLNLAASAKPDNASGMGDTPLFWQSLAWGKLDKTKQFSGENAVFLEWKRLGFAALLGRAAAVSV